MLELQCEQHNRQPVKLNVGVFHPGGVVGINQGKLLGPKADVLAQARGEDGKFRSHGGFYLQAGFPRQPEPIV